MSEQIELTKDEAKVIAYALIFYSEWVNSEIHSLTHKAMEGSAGETIIDKYKSQHYLSQLDNKKSLSDNISVVFDRIVEKFNIEELED